MLILMCYVAVKADAIVALRQLVQLLCTCLEVAALSFYCTSSDSNRLPAHHTAFMAPLQAHHHLAVMQEDTICVYAITETTHGEMCVGLSLAKCMQDLI